MVSLHRKHFTMILVFLFCIALGWDSGQEQVVSGPLSVTEGLQPGLSPQLNQLILDRFSVKDQEPIMA